MSPLSEAMAMFAMSLLVALTAVLSIHADYRWSLFFAILSVAIGASAFWAIFADIRRNEKLPETKR